MLADVDPALLPYVQLCDGNLACAPDYEHLLEDALDLRCAPGEGELPLHTVVGALPDGEPFSLEVRSRVYRERYPNPVERARAVREQTERFLMELA